MINSPGKSTLVFQATAFDAIDRNEQPWLRSLQIASALGYKNPSTDIQNLYDRNVAEFTDSMTTLIELPTAGGKQQVRIFSLRGAHLLGMLSRTEKAADFRRWVLDVLERETAQPPRPPEIPLREIIHQRWLVSFNSDGRTQTTPVSPSACILDPSDTSALRTLIHEALPFELIPKVIEMANERILNCHQVEQLRRQLYERKAGSTQRKLDAYQAHKAAQKTRTADTPPKTALPAPKPTKRRDRVTVSKSGVKGVFPCQSKYNPWRAQIWDPRLHKAVMVGVFPDIESAQDAQEAYLKEHGL